MMRKSFFIGAIFILLSSTLLWAREDVPDSKDHPIISRYLGSKIIHYERKKFDRYSLLTGPVKDIKNAPTMRLEGTVTKITYRAPKDRSVFEVYKNYELALEKADFEAIYQGEGNEVRNVGTFLSKVNREHTGGFWEGDRYYLSAKSTDNKFYISLYVKYYPDGPLTVLAVVEPKTMETELVTVRMMKDQIAKTGKVAIYGIYFDFDSAEIKKESRPTIDEIAKLLKDNPDLKLFVVGHTDNTGELDYNMNLSKRRAEAVVRDLIENYGIKKERLKAMGVGPLSPRDSNKTEEGRAKNRRVELVEQ